MHGDALTTSEEPRFLDCHFHRSPRYGQGRGALSSGDAAPVKITVVQNWFAGFKDKQKQ
jgi:hypothetical protein